jgi:translation initiation factor 2 subunit 2
VEIKEYEKLLDKAYGELPEILKEYSRFVIPRIAARIQGKVTVVQNLGEVSKLINRKPDMLAKYLLREFGTMGSRDDQRLLMKGRFRQYQVQEKFEEFLNLYVICPECGRPDTRIVQEMRVNFLKCEACGSRHPIGVIKAAPKREKRPEIGDVITLQVTQTGKKGDGVAKMGKYIIFISNAREGQKVKAKINNIQGTMVFAEAVEILS